jgi:prepilin-type N-terminal cleavage/methylation domain-containing protein
MTRQPHPPFRKAFSLLELIGVLAVMAVLAAIILPILTRSIDRVANERETAELAAFETGLRQSIMRQGYLTNWANLPDQIANELGAEPTRVSSNARRQPRFFLVDPLMQLGTNAPGQLYVQTDAGSVVTNSSGVIPPVNPRLIIITSMGPPLSGVTGGPNADFDAIWNTAAGQTPATAALSSWGGKPSDLRIKRINLSDLFVHLILTSNGSQAAGKYSVSSANYLTASALPVEAYFFRNSVLELYNGGGSLDSKQILTKDCSFVYDQNVWRSTLNASYTSELDLRSIANNFLHSTLNSAAGSTPAAVVQSMITYLDAYRAWATLNFNNAGFKNTAIAAQADMVTKVQELYLSPTHAPVEVVCP